jgi:hypothetical protein
MLVRDWRTTFTAGLIWARGHEKQDLTPIVEECSDENGFALADVSASNVPLPTPAWKRSIYVSATFTLAGF